jgi:hypothetical protein
MFIPNAPERSYWECEWRFPNTGSVVSVGLPGSEDGPTADSRRFYLGLPERFDRIMAAARPKLEQVFMTWLQQELPEDILSVVKLTGFGVEDPRAQPIEWDVAFETTGDKWLGITIPFVGEEPQEAVVDT